MSKVDPEYIIALSKAVLAALRRTGRLPVRLDSEDYDDLQSEGVLAALSILDRYDPARGTLRAYLDKPIGRAILKAAWRIANAGITGDHGSLQIFSTDVGINAYDHDNNTFDNEHPWITEVSAAMSHPDVAEEIEAFDHVWKTRYMRD